MENKSFIKEILEDFKEKRMKPFFDLDQYETDYEMSNLFKFLRIGYLNKKTINNPYSAYYIEFNKKGFELSCPAYSIGTIIKDTYNHYSSVQEVYEKLVIAINNMNDK